VAGTVFLGTVIDGRYRVDQEIGSGGFATVHAGFHLSLGVPIAIKFLRLSPDTPPARRAELLAGFMDEGRLATRLRHDHIVRTLDQGIFHAEGAELGSPYVVLEWCGDESLARMLRNRNGAGLPLDVAYQLIEAITSAMAHAHELGVAHRDLKPGNVMLAKSPSGTWIPRVIDFGIAKLFEHEHPSGDSISATRFPAKYTPAYAAPEQVAGLRTGPWTDVHGIGLLFVELTTGRSPYSAPGLGPIDPRRPSPRDYGVDVGPFEPLIAHALAFDPRHRFQNAGELLSALRSAAHTSRSQTTQGPVSNTVATGPTPVPKRGALVWVVGIVLTLVVGVGLAIGARYALSQRAGVASVSSSVVAVSASQSPPAARLGGRGVLLSVMTRADLDKRARGAGVEITGDGEAHGNIYVHFRDKSGSSGTAYVTLAPMNPALPEKSRELAALSAVKSWIEYDREHGLELVYGIQGDHVLSVASSDEKAAVAVFDKLASGIELRIRGSSFGRPDPATQADDAKLHWRAKSLSDLTLPELMSRIAVADANLGEVTIAPHHWSVVTGRAQHRGRVDVFQSTGPRAEALLASIKRSNVAYSEVKSGTARVVVHGPGGLGQKAFLDKVLSDLQL
jgi:hypothetical protein